MKDNKNRSTLAKVLILSLGFSALGVGIHRYLTMNTRRFSKSASSIVRIEPEKDLPVVVFDSKQDYIKPVRSGIILGRYLGDDYLVTIAKPKLPGHLQSIIEYYGYSYVLVGQQGGLVGEDNYQVLLVFKGHLFIDVGINGTDHQSGLMAANFGWCLDDENGDMEYFYVQDGREENKVTELGYLPDESIAQIIEMIEDRD